MQEHNHLHKETSGEQAETATSAAINNNDNEQKPSFPIIVIGASAGGLEALKTLVAGLPKNLGASLFIVWHMSADVRGILPYLLNKAETLYAAHAYDGETIVPNRIYIAPPDKHMLIRNGHLHLSRGPKENRFRPAVDPLFRSAAMYGPQVIGIILSGSLNDGTAGLWTIKNYGGLAIVQDPRDAEVHSMPESAMKEVEVDYVVPATKMAALLHQLVKTNASQPKKASMQTDEHTNIEIRIASDENAMQAGVLKLGNLSPFTCPECHGVLLAITEGKFKRYRCHTGHAFTTDSLLAAVTETIEDSLWNAIRGIEESTMLLNTIGDHYAENNQPKLAAIYFKNAKEAFIRSEAVRQIALHHEQLSQDKVEEEAEKNSTEN